MTQELYDYYNRIEGLNWWHENLKDLKDYELLIVIKEDGVPSWADNVKVEYISQYNIHFWARPKDLKPHILDLLISKMPLLEKMGIKRRLVGCHATPISKWVIKYKEVGKDRIGTCSHSGNLSREEVIEFFGLNEPGVEWYEMVNN